MFREDMKSIKNDMNQSSNVTLQFKEKLPNITGETSFCDVRILNGHENNLCDIEMSGGVEKHCDATVKFNAERQSDVPGLRARIYELPLPDSSKPQLVIIERKTCSSCLNAESMKEEGSKLRKDVCYLYYPQTCGSAQLHEVSLHDASKFGLPANNLEVNSNVTSSEPYVMGIDNDVSHCKVSQSYIRTLSAVDTHSAYEDTASRDSLVNEGIRLPVARPMLPPCDPQQSKPPYGRGPGIYGADMMSRYAQKTSQIPVKAESENTVLRNLVESTPYVAQNGAHWQRRDFSSVLTRHRSPKYHGLLGVSSPFRPIEPAAATRPPRPHVEPMYTAYPVFTSNPYEGSNPHAFYHSKGLNAQPPDRVRTAEFAAVDVRYRQNVLQDMTPSATSTCTYQSKEAGISAAYAPSNDNALSTIEFDKSTEPNKNCMDPHYMGSLQHSMPTAPMPHHSQSLLPQPPPQPPPPPNYMYVSAGQESCKQYSKPPTCTSPPALYSVASDDCLPKLPSHSELNYLLRQQMSPLVGFGEHLSEDSTCERIALNDPRIVSVTPLDATQQGMSSQGDARCFPPLSTTTFAHSDMPLSNTRSAPVKRRQEKRRRSSAGTSSGVVKRRKSKTGAVKNAKHGNKDETSHVIEQNCSTISCRSGNVISYEEFLQEVQSDGAGMKTVVVTSVPSAEHLAARSDAAVSENGQQTIEIHVQPEDVVVFIDEDSVNGVWHAPNDVVTTSYDTELPSEVVLNDPVLASAGMQHFTDRTDNIVSGSNQPIPHTNQPIPLPNQPIPVPNQAEYPPVSSRGNSLSMSGSLGMCNFERQSDPITGCEYNANQCQDAIVHGDLEAESLREVRVVNECYVDSKPGECAQNTQYHARCESVSTDPHCGSQDDYEKATLPGAQCCSDASKSSSTENWHLTDGGVRCECWPVSRRDACASDARQSTERVSIVTTGSDYSANSRHEHDATGESKLPVFQSADEHILLESSGLNPGCITESTSPENSANLSGSHQGVSVHTGVCAESKQGASNVHNRVSEHCRDIDAADASKQAVDNVVMAACNRESESSAVAQQSMTTADIEFRSTIACAVDKTSDVDGSPRFRAEETEGVTDIRSESAEDITHMMMSEAAEDITYMMRSETIEDITHMTRSEAAEDITHMTRSEAAEDITHMTSAEAAEDITHMSSEATKNIRSEVVEDNAHMMRSEADEDVPYKSSKAAEDIPRMRSEVVEDCTHMMMSELEAAQVCTQVVRSELEPFSQDCNHVMTTERDFNTQDYTHVMTSEPEAVTQDESCVKSESAQIDQQLDANNESSSTQLNDQVDDHGMCVSAKLDQQFDSFDESGPVQSEQTERQSQVPHPNSPHVEMQLQVLDPSSAPDERQSLCGPDSAQIKFLSSDVGSLLDAASMTAACHRNSPVSRSNTGTTAAHATALKGGLTSDTCEEVYPEALSKAESEACAVFNCDLDTVNSSYATAPSTTKTALEAAASPARSTRSRTLRAAASSVPSTPKKPPQAAVSSTPSTPKRALRVVSSAPNTPKRTLRVVSSTPDTPKRALRAAASAETSTPRKLLQAAAPHVSASIAPNKPPQIIVSISSSILDDSSVTDEPMDRFQIEKSHAMVALAASACSSCHSPTAVDSAALDHVTASDPASRVCTVNDVGIQTPSSQLRRASPRRRVRRRQAFGTSDDTSGTSDGTSGTTDGTSGADSANSVVRRGDASDGTMEAAVAVSCISGSTDEDSHVPETGACHGTEKRVLQCVDGKTPTVSRASQTVDAAPMTFTIMTAEGQQTTDRMPSNALAASATLVSTALQPGNENNSNGGSVIGGGVKRKQPRMMRVRRVKQRRSISCGASGRKRRSSSSRGQTARKSTEKPVLLDAATDVIVCTPQENAAAHTVANEKANDTGETTATDMTAQASANSDEYLWLLGPCTRSLRQKLMTILTDESAASNQPPATDRLVDDSKADGTVDYVHDDDDDDQVDEVGREEECIKQTRDDDVFDVVADHTDNSKDGDDALTSPSAKDDNESVASSHSWSLPSLTDDRTERDLLQLSFFKPEVIASPDVDAVEEGKSVPKIKRRFSRGGRSSSEMKQMSAEGQITARQSMTSWIQSVVISKEDQQRAEEKRLEATATQKHDPNTRTLPPCNISPMTVVSPDVSFSPGRDASPIGKVSSPGDASSNSNNLATNQSPERPSSEIDFRNRYIDENVFSPPKESSPLSSMTSRQANRSDENYLDTAPRTQFGGLLERCIETSLRRPSAMVQDKDSASSSAKHVTFSNSMTVYTVNLSLAPVISGVSVQLHPVSDSACELSKLTRTKQSSNMNERERRRLNDLLLTKWVDALELDCHIDGNNASAATATAAVDYDTPEGRVISPDVDNIDQLVKQAVSGDETQATLVAEPQPDGATQQPDDTKQQLCDSKPQQCSDTNEQGRLGCTKQSLNDNKQQLVYCKQRLGNCKKQLNDPRTTRCFSNTGWETYEHTRPQYSRCGLTAMSANEKHSSQGTTIPLDVPADAVRSRETKHLAIEAGTYMSVVDVDAKWPRTPLEHVHRQSPSARAHITAEPEVPLDWKTSEILKDPENTEGSHADRKKMEHQGLFSSYATPPRKSRRSTADEKEQCEGRFVSKLKTPERTKQSARENQKMSQQKPVTPDKAKQRVAGEKRVTQQQEPIRQSHARGTEKTQRTRVEENKTLQYKEPCSSDSRTPEKSQQKATEDKEILNQQERVTSYSRTPDKSRQKSVNEEMLSQTRASAGPNVKQAARRQAAEDTTKKPHMKSCHEKPASKHSGGARSEKARPQVALSVDPCRQLSPADTVVPRSSADGTKTSHRKYDADMYGYETEDMSSLIIAENTSKVDKRRDFKCVESKKQHAVSQKRKETNPKILDTTLKSGVACHKQSPIKSKIRKSGTTKSDQTFLRHTEDRKELHSRGDIMTARPERLDTSTRRNTGDQKELHSRGDIMTARPERLDTSTRRNTGDQKELHSRGDVMTARPERLDIKTHKNMGDQQMLHSKGDVMTARPERLDTSTRRNAGDQKQLHPRGDVMTARPECLDSSTRKNAGDQKQLHPRGDVRTARPERLNTTPRKNAADQKQVYSQEVVTASTHELGHTKPRKHTVDNVPTSRTERLNTTPRKSAVDQKQILSKDDVTTSTPGRGNTTPRKNTVDKQQAHVKSDVKRSKSERLDGTPSKHTRSVDTCVTDCYHSSTTAQKDAHGQLKDSLPDNETKLRGNGSRYADRSVTGADKFNLWRYNELEREYERFSAETETTLALSHVNPPAPCSHVDSPAPCSHVDSPAPCSHVDPPAPCSHVDPPAACSHVDSPAPCSHVDSPALLASRDTDAQHDVKVDLDSREHQLRTPILEKVARSRISALASSALAISPDVVAQQRDITTKIDLHLPKFVKCIANDFENASQMKNVSTEAEAAEAAVELSSACQERLVDESSLSLLGFGKALSGVDDVITPPETDHSPVVDDREHGGDGGGVGGVPDSSPDQCTFVGPQTPDSCAPTSNSSLNTPPPAPDSDEKITPVKGVPDEPLCPEKTEVGQGPVAPSVDPATPLLDEPQHHQPDIYDKIIPTVSLLRAITHESPFVSTTGEDSVHSTTSNKNASCSDPPDEETYRFVYSPISDTDIDFKCDEIESESGDNRVEDKLEPTQQSQLQTPTVVNPEAALCSTASGVISQETVLNNSSTAGVVDHEMALSNTQAAGFSHETVLNDNVAGVVNLETALQNSTVGDDTTKSTEVYDQIQQVIESKIMALQESVRRESLGDDGSGNGNSATSSHSVAVAAAAVPVVADDVIGEIYSEMQQSEECLHETSRQIEALKRQLDKHCQHQQHEAPSYATGGLERGEGQTRGPDQIRQSHSMVQRSQSDVHSSHGHMHQSKDQMQQTHNILQQSQSQIQLPQNQGQNGQMQRQIYHSQVPIHENQTNVRQDQGYLFQSQAYHCQGQPHESRTDQSQGQIHQNQTQFDIVPYSQNQPGQVCYNQCQTANSQNVQSNSSYHCPIPGSVAGIGNSKRNADQSQCNTFQNQSYLFASHGQHQPQWHGDPRKHAYAPTRCHPNYYYYQGHYYGQGQGQHSQNVCATYNNNPVSSLSSGSRRIVTDLHEFKIDRNSARDKTINAAAVDARTVTAAAAVTATAVTTAAAAVTANQPLKGSAPVAECNTTKGQRRRSASTIYTIVADNSMPYASLSTSTDSATSNVVAAAVCDKPLDNSSSSTSLSAPDSSSGAGCTRSADRTCLVKPFLKTQETQAVSSESYGRYSSSASTAAAARAAVYAHTGVKYTTYSSRPAAYFNTESQVSRGMTSQLPVVSFAGNSDAAVKASAYSGAAAVVHQHAQQQHTRPAAGRGHTLRFRLENVFDSSSSGKEYGVIRLENGYRVGYVTEPNRHRYILLKEAGLVFGCTQTACIICKSVIVNKYSQSLPRIRAGNLQVNILNKIKNCYAAMNDVLVDFDSMVRFYDVMLMDIRSAHGFDVVSAHNYC